jgi:hypothetical protein
MDELTSDQMHKAVVIALIQKVRWGRVATELATGLIKEGHQVHVWMERGTR